MRNFDPYVRSGVLCAVAAHTLWGLLPLYWWLLHDVPALQLVCHRIIWSFVLLLVLVPVLLQRGRLGRAAELVAAIRCPRAWGIYSLAAAMIGINWFVFVWAVTNDRVLESSLGYYINPLLNVLLGVLLLGERLWPAQWLAVGIAALGVAIMALLGGGMPWVALLMATAFAVYGLIKKKAPLPALTGLLFETVILLIPALAYVAVLEARGEGAMGLAGLVGGGGLGEVRLQAAATVGSGYVRLARIGLLIVGGFVTVLPLALFAVAARRVPLSMIGLLQYVGPTLQFFVGAVLLGEPFEGGRVVGFVCVWAGLLLFLISLRRVKETSALEEIEEIVETGESKQRAEAVGVV